MGTRFQLRLLAAQPDDKLAALVRDGHDRAFEAVVLRYRRELLRHCRRLKLPEQLAEEALQQTFVNAWVALRRSAEVRELRPWLHRIAHNVALDIRRREQQDELGVSEDARESAGRFGPPGSPTASPEPAVEDALAVRSAFSEMAQLPPLQREVIVRTAIAGHSHEQVASALGISDGAVRGLLYRARAHLRATAAAPLPG